MARYSRFLEQEHTYLTANQMRPYVVKAMTLYKDILRERYGDNLLSIQEATENALVQLHIVLIEDEYLLGYFIGHEFCSHAPIMQEEFLIRIQSGDVGLPQVFDVIRLLKKCHNVEECRLGTMAPGNQRAIQHLYKKHGAEPVLTIMRI